MAKCQVCGNEYDKCFEVHLNNNVYVFDSFECAIAALAPVCNNCNCRVIGHGVEANGIIFCCVHCAQQKGVVQLKDRINHHEEVMKK